MVRAALWVLGAVGSLVSANSILRGQQEHQIIMAGLAVAGVLMPGLIKAVQLDAAIRDYADGRGDLQEPARGVPAGGQGLVE